MDIRTVAWTLRDLLQRANLKLQEIDSFDTQNLNGVDQNEAENDEIEIRKQMVTSLMGNLLTMTKEVEELKEQKEALSNVLVEKESGVDSLAKAVKERKANQKREIEDFEKNQAKNVEEFLKDIQRELDKSKHNFTKREAEIVEKNERLKQDITILKTENAEMENDLRESKDQYYQSYIGQVCFDLQANMYHFVLPDQFTPKRPYKIKDIEEDLEDEDLLNDEERDEAEGRWEDLKGKLCWKPSLERTLKMLQEDGNPCMARPECLTVEEAENAAEELNKRGKLKGRTSYEKVKQIIKMWKESMTMVQSLHEL